MRQYIYSPQEVGIDSWPSGELRLEGIDTTTYPTEADIFVCPGNIRLFETIAGTGQLNHSKLRALPYFVGNESRHVFFDVSDNFKQSINLPIMFIRCDVRSWMLTQDPNTLQMGWPVDDFGDCVDISPDGFKYDVSFHGWISTETRRRSAESCLSSDNVKCDIAQYSDFCGYIYNTAEGIRRRKAFRRSMKESRIALCPESIPGVFPYRFFEAMSAGRVPLLIGSDLVFPFASEIPYSDFMIHIQRDDAPIAGYVVRRSLDQTSDGELIEKGKVARQYWLKYLDSRRWPEIMAYAVRKHLGALITN